MGEPRKRGYKPTLFASIGLWGSDTTSSCPPSTRLRSLWAGTTPPHPPHAGIGSQGSGNIPSHPTHTGVGSQGSDAAPSSPLPHPKQISPGAQHHPCLSLCMGIGCQIQYAGPGALHGSRDLAAGEWCYHSPAAEFPDPRETPQVR